MSAGTSIAPWTYLLYTGVSGATSALLQSRLGPKIPGAPSNFVYEINAGGRRERGRIHLDTMDIEVRESAPSTSPSRVKSIAEFVDWGTALCPSEQVALVLQDHGYPSDSPPSDDSRKRVVSSRSWLVPTRPPRGGPLSLRDGDQAAASLTNSGLRKAVQRTRRQKVDHYGLDACYLGSIELAYELRKVTPYVVSTETELRVDAWPYPQAMDAICRSPAVNPRQLASITAGIDDAPRLVALDSAWMGDVAATLDVVAAALLKALPSERSTIELVWRGAKEITSGQRDFLEVVEGLIANFGAGAMGPSLREVKAAFLEARFAAARSIVDGRGAGGGVEIFFPAPGGTRDWSLYGDLEFARKHRWREFLEEFSWPG